MLKKMPVNLAAFYVVQKMCEATRMKMDSKKKGKEKRETAVGSLEFAVGTRRDPSLKLNLDFRDCQNALTHLGSCGVAAT